MSDNKPDYLNGSVNDFIAATAAKQSTPGGGSVAAVVGALGVALAEMTLNFTRGKKKYAEHEPLYEEVGGRFAKARALFGQLMTDDMEAFTLYQQAQKMPDGTDKDQAMDVATASAVNVPRETAKLTLAMMEDMHRLAGKANPYLISDLVAGAALAVAVTKLCDYNVRVNLAYVKDQDAAADLRVASRTDVAKASNLLAEIEAAAKDQLGP